MALVVNEPRAKLSGCTCYYLGNKDIELPARFDKSVEELGISYDEVLCFSKGAVGGLTNVQEEEFCSGGIVLESKKLKERLKCMSDCAKKCGGE